MKTMNGATKTMNAATKTIQEILSHGQKNACDESIGSNVAPRERLPESLVLDKISSDLETSDLETSDWGMLDV